MKILMVTREQGQDRVYGLGKSLEPVCAALRGLGHEVLYLSQAEAGRRGVEFSLKLADRLSGWLGRAGNPLFARAFAERLNMGRLAATLAAREGYTHVHLHDPWIAWGFRQCSRLRRHRPRWGLTEHGYGCYSHATLEDGLAQGAGLQGRLRRLEASVTQSADWCVFPTEAALAQTLRDLCLADPPPHWRAIPHPRPALNLRPRAEARQALGWAEGRRHVVAVGRLAPLKRFELLLRAVALLPREWETQTVILGGGDAGPLRRLADELHIAPPVVALTEDVGLYLSAADAYASASATESFGLANLEALAAGLPCACVALPPVAEVVGAAAVLAAGEAAALAAGLGELLADPARAAHYSQAARARAADWPDAHEVARRYVALYQGLA